MGWFSTQAERHQEFAATFSEEWQREAAAFYASVGRMPYYSYETRSVNAAARDRAISRVKQLRGFSNDNS